MININLLPQEMRREEKSPGDVKLGKYFVFPAVILFLVIGLNILLGIVLIYKKANILNLNNQWSRFTTSYKPVEEIKKKMKVLEDKLAFFEKLTGRDISWSEKLNILSDQLPEGAWFRKVEIKHGSLIEISGSIVSLVEDEVSLLNQYVANLKKDNNFFKDFEDVELKSLTKHGVKNFEVADFILSFSAK